MDKVAVIIVTYNGMEWIEKCLNSIPLHYSIIIVDNGSTDETVSFIKANFNNPVVFEQIDNLGFGRANNLGISFALNNGFDYMFLLNQDAYLFPESIDTLINCYKKNKTFGVISPVHLNGKGTALDVAFSGYMEQNNTLSKQIHSKSEETKVFEVPFVNAAGWLLPKETINVVGGFDPIFYHYGEDDNYCQRVQYHNLKVGVVTGAYLKHDREQRPPKKLNTINEQLIEKERYYKRSLGNINIEFDEFYNNSKSVLKRKLFKAFFKLKLNSAYKYFRELQLLTELVSEVKISRVKNKKQGIHYIEL